MSPPSRLYDALSRYFESMLDQMARCLFPTNTLLDDHQDHQEPERSSQWVLARTPSVELNVPNRTSDGFEDRSQ